MAKWRPCDSDAPRPAQPIAPRGPHHIRVDQFRLIYARVLLVLVGLHAAPPAKRVRTNLIDELRRDPVA